MSSGDYGAIYDLLSADAQKQIKTQIDTMATDEAAAGMAKAMLGFDPAELKGMPTREAFAKMMKATMAMAEKMMKSMAEAMGGEAPSIADEIAKSKVTDSKVDGDTGSVTITDGKGKANAIEVIKEGGSWKFKTPPSGAPGAGPSMGG